MPSKNSTVDRADSIIIGGGFYGAAIAIHLAKHYGWRKLILVEQEKELLTRASYANQARVHNGYHYPRSFTTAYRSGVNQVQFLRDWPQAIKRDFTKLYAIARRNSKTTARQFQRFCQAIKVPLEPADPSLRALFEEKLIEDVFLVEEYVFDATKLAQWAEGELKASGVELRLQTKATEILKTENTDLAVRLQDSSGGTENIRSQYVFNCTYCGLNQLKGDFSPTQTKLQQEITEMALMEMPPELQGLGITVMDGPFFSLMPFPTRGRGRGVHTLSHTRYTPHLSWTDEAGIDPYKKLHAYARHTRVERMIRDASRYLPAIAGAQYIDSLFEVKTVLAKNENNDGRPILFEKHPKLQGCYSVLGGKIDNIYDILQGIDREMHTLSERKSQ